ncbi:MAG: family 20 glycosylhydrolase [Opitutaceae bacterium]|nr:family 20 glycosylhydrolase [Opitutaceae bacterium]
MSRSSLLAVTTTALFLSVAPRSAVSAVPTPVSVMPLPHSVVAAEGRLPITAKLTVALRGHDDARLRAGLARALRRAEERTGLTFARTPQAAYVISGDSSAATLVIECGAAAAAVPVLGEDESYTLAITPSQAVLRAPTVHGVLHGLETTLQLLQGDAGGWFLPAMRIEDRPRFPWRGLMLDVCRHWQPMEVVKRTLDGMALAKLNVLHLHLTEDQGFRIESKSFPRLHEMGSDGLYFTQEQMREIIAYAAERCIRVVPEFDIPGHATSWLVGHPEIGSAPGPYVIERKWGIFDPVLDPTNPRTYEILDGFLTEMAALFPDPYLHIGGDENNGVHWSANAKIQQYIRDHDLKDLHGLHTHFNNRVHAILARNGKRLVGWDEILHPDLASGSVVHSWRGPDGIAAATALGFATILSNGYYIDLSHPTVDHYLNDPIPPGSKLTEAQQKLVLGGEATMWAEWVTPETIDSRLWPRTAAIAERLWSRQDVRDVDDMYRRLGYVSRRLEEAGMRHLSYIDPALRRLAGDGASAEDLVLLREFVDLLEPVKVYQRGRHQPDATQHTPLTGLVDCTRPDSRAARGFAAQVDLYLRNPKAPAVAETLSAQLKQWDAMARRLSDGLVKRSPRLREAEPLVQALGAACGAGRDAIEILTHGTKPPARWREAQLSALERAGKPFAAVEFPIMPAIRALVEAAAQP